MKYIKNFYGLTLIKDKKDISILGKEGFIHNPSEELLEKHGWEIYDKQEFLNSYKQEIINLIINYDKSSFINNFTINGNNIWLDKATRVGLMLRLQSEQQAGYTNTTLWYNNVEYVLSIEMAILMLHSIEIYASKCYDTTLKHIATVMSLDNVLDVKLYNYSTGYPELLRFNTSLI